MAIVADSVDEGQRLIGAGEVVATYLFDLLVSTGCRKKMVVEVACVRNSLNER